MSATDKRIVDELRELRAAQQLWWQPIGTAPKDGTWVLTFGSLHDDGDVDMGKTGWFCFDWHPLPPPPAPEAP